MHEMSDSSAAHAPLCETKTAEPGSGFCFLNTSCPAVPSVLLRVSGGDPTPSHLFVKESESHNFDRVGGAARLALI